MKGEQELLDMVAGLCVSWYGMPAISTQVIAWPTAHSAYYVVERQFAFGNVWMYLYENRHGHVVQDFVIWRTGLSGL